MLSIFLTLILYVLLFAIAWGQCFWTNFIRGFNVMLCSALAFNYAQPLANLINEQIPDWSAFTEFLVIWVLFIILYLISNTICSQISKYPVRFGKKADKIMDVLGCFSFAGTLQGWILFTLFAAPIGDEAFLRNMAAGAAGRSGMGYGMYVIALPSNLGMRGNPPIEIKQWAKTRLERARDEVNHGD